MPPESNRNPLFLGGRKLEYRLEIGLIVLIRWFVCLFVMLIRCIFVFDRLRVSAEKIQCT